MQSAIDLGLHNYSVHRTTSRAMGDMVFNAGEWSATVGDKSFHGYYSAILGSEHGEVKILEETVNVAAPEQFAASDAEFHYRIVLDRSLR